MTPHNEAKKDEIAKIVIMPGDPLRAKYIAENFMEDAKLVNKVRGMYAYTGKYKGKTLTVMAHGMGIPSMGIYSYELYKFYDVDTIIRIGSCGAYIKELNLKDTVLIEEAYSESSYAKIQNGSEYNLIKSDNELNEQIEKIAKEINIKLRSIKVYSTEAFYSDLVKPEEMYNKYGCSAVEMETFALFHNAKVLNKKATCIATITDSLVSKEEMSPNERQTALTDMITLALETAIKI